MTLNIGFYKIAEYIGMNFENTILLIVILGGLIFYAKDFKVGLILHFFGFACLFAWFYQASLDYKFPLILMLMTLVLISFNLYALAKSSEKGAVI